MHSPVLFIIFNRPRSSKRVLKAIREAKPSRIYIAADGPRVTHECDLILCNQARRIITEIDWPCEVKMLFQDENLGRRFGPKTAIDWFFDHEEEGIILDDAGLPHLDFFAYCDWALDAYRRDKSVWHVNGSNFACPDRACRDSAISFSALAQVGGWATWKDRWQRCIDNPFYLMDKVRSKKAYWLISYFAKVNMSNRIFNLQEGLSDTWKYQWQATILNYQGLCVCYRSKLINSISDGTDKTQMHLDGGTWASTKPIDGMLKYVRPSLNIYLTRWHEKSMGLRKFYPVLSYLKRFVKVKVSRSIRERLAKILFANISRIVIASSGRNGSTLVYDAVCQSLVSHRFGVNANSKVGRVLVKWVGRFTDRLSDVSNSNIPVHKTHDLYDPIFIDIGKCVFVYGDPLESALSVRKMVEKYGRLWFDEHQYHLQAFGNYGDLLECDVLNYEEQVNCWIKNSYGNIFIVNYEEIWDRSDELSHYLGIKINLPDRRDRDHKPTEYQYNNKLFNHMRAIADKNS